MNASLRQQQGEKGRTNKYAEFQQFYDKAESLFTEFIKRDFGDPPSISITIRPGGRKGGQDKRLVEIFFSPITYDTISLKDSGLAKNSSQEGPHMLRESGPCLVYQRVDTGDIFCILQPATTDESKVNEDMVILQTVRKPRTLNKLAHSHWKDLLVYRECTSVNGAPSPFEKLRCAYLRHFHRLGKDRKFQPAKAPKWLRQFAAITFSFALGGFITTMIEKCVFPDSIQTPKDSSGAKKLSGTSNSQPSLPPSRLPKASRPGNKTIMP